MANRVTRFITLEGIDGAGKSTHLPWIVERIAGRGVEVVATREPGGTALGESLRDLLLSRPMSHDAEALLMFAARREHVEQVIGPALHRGAWVVCDRFTDATYAYQGGGHGVDRAFIAELALRIHPSCNPDLTLLFDVPIGVSRARLDRSHAGGRTLDRFETEAHAFFERVRAAYLERAEREPGRFRVIDSTRSPDDVRKRLAAILDEL